MIVYLIGSMIVFITIPIIVHIFCLISEVFANDKMTDNGRRILNIINQADDFIYLTDYCIYSDQSELKIHRDGLVMLQRKAVHGLSPYDIEKMIAEYNRVRKNRVARRLPINKKIVQPKSDTDFIKEIKECLEKE